MKSVAIVQHIANDSPSFFATWLTQKNIPFHTFCMHEGDALPEHIEAHSGLCILGGAMSANDPLPYYPRLFEQVREAIGKDIPVIGHCLGGQIMSRALGGTVQAAENAEIGWSDLNPVHAKAADWFGAEAPLQLFQWHSESFSIPPGATHLLTSAHCANQAYLVGDKHLGMQFHCEVDDEKVREWLVSGKDEMQTCVSPGVQQADAILKTLAQDLQRSQGIASRIYTKWAEGLRA